MLLTSFLMTIGMSAQNGTTLTGVVKDETGFPLPGVNIIEKGTKNTSSTDMDGKFKMKLTTDKAVITVSYIGFENQSVSVSGKSVVNISLKPNAESLDEVKIVSFGYGTIKRENLTGAVSSIGAKELSKIPVTNVAEALAGRLAGVSIQSVDGAPGSDIVIRVRGGGSLTQDNSPLYVVDGFVVDNLNDIPPGDIQSIDLLKDAATTAIYGAQGANGVVIVTTKKPKAGKTVVTLNHYMQLNTLPKDRKYEVLSPYEFVSMQYETAKMAGTTNVTNFEKFFGKYDDLELYKSKKPNDWQEQVLGREVVSYYTNLSISGGSESTKFLVSYSANNDEGLMIGSGEKRNAINFKINHDISKKLKVDLSARITDRQIDGAGTVAGQMSVKNMLTLRPTNGIADGLVFDPNVIEENEQYEQFFSSLKSPAEIVKQDWRKRSNTTYVLNAGITWNIIDNLTFKSTLNSEKGYGENLRFYGPLTGESQQNGNSLPLGVKVDADAHSYRFSNTLNYDFKNIGKHEIGILLGQEVRSKGGKIQSIRVEDFRASITPAELFANLVLGRVDTQYTTELTDENWYSLFAKGNYSYDDKYLFTATIRRDASSKFLGANNIGIFPAFSAGWKISSEPFLKNSKIVNELKLRFGYGSTGNDRIPANSTKFLFEASSIKGPGFGDNTNEVFYTPLGSTLYNPDLIWETTITRNIGLDFRLFDSVLNGSLELYKNTTNDLLLPKAESPISGFTTKWDNIGSNENRGVELSLNANVIEKKDFTLGLTMNFGINRNKILEYDGSDEKFIQSNWASSDLKDRNDYYLKLGKSVGMIYGYVTDGMYTVDDFDQLTPTTYALKAGIPSNAGTIGTTVRPGTMKLKDLDGDGAITSADRKVIGETLPKAQGGFGLNTSYKGFDLSAFFNWSYGNDVYNTGKIDYNQLYRTTYGNMLNTMNSANRFTYIDTDGTYTGTPGNVVTDLAQLGEMNAGKTMWSGNMSFGNATAVVSDWGIEDGSYIRLNNVTLGYTLPIKEYKKSIFSSARFYVTGSNLAIWTKYSGYDPDVNSNRNNAAYAALTPGMDYSSYPRGRRYTFGMNLTF